MDPTPERTVAANARRLRKDRGYSQQRVAELMTEAGYPTGEMPLWALEKGKRRIKVADLYGLAAALDVTPESLLAAESTPEGLHPGNHASTPDAAPHPECPVGESDAPLVAFARIGLHVEPGFTDGVTATSWSKDAILPDADSALMPDVDIKGAQSLSLKGTRQIFAGDEQAQIFVDGRRYTTSSEHPVIVEPFGPDMDGAFVTLTLIADKVTVDNKEISE
jgi:transcriptional regulator with XRE-family HTH domain